MLRVRCPGPLGSCSPLCPLGVLCCVCGVLGHLAPVHWCARSVCCFACAVSWATWLLFTGVPARCVALLVRFPGPLGSCSQVCPLGVLCCVCGVQGHLAPVHRCPCSACCVACAVSWATWLLFTAVPARCAVLRVRCRGPLGSCSPVWPLGALLCVCGVLGHLAPVHRCGRSVRCFACAVFWATWLLFTGVPARGAVLRVRCPGPLGSCSPVCPVVVLSVCAVSWATWLLFTGVPARCVVLLVRCRGPLGSCAPVCPLSALLCVLGVLGHFAPVQRCARVVCCVACAVSWATWLVFTGVPARCAALLVRCLRPLGSCSAVCLLRVLPACAVSWATWLVFTGVPARCVGCVCGVLGHLAPVHRCACLVRCFACAVSRATWLLFTDVPARCLVLRVWCPGPIGSCSPVCLLGVLCTVCGVLGHLAPVHRCARSVCCVACALSWATWLLFTSVPAPCVACVCGVLGHSCSPVCPLGALAVCAVCWATWLLFTGVPAWCVAFLVRCPAPLGSCSPVCPLGVLCCVCGVLGHLAPVHRCARSVRWLCVRCAGPLGSCSPVCLLGALLCLCGVPRHLAPVHRCARSVCCVACAVSLATWLLFTGVPAWCVVLRVRCPWRLGSCSPVCPLGVLCCVCGVLGHLARVHRCARSVRWLCVRCAGPLGSCPPVCLLGALLCLCGVPRHLAPVHRCARSVCCVACAVSLATWLMFTGVPARCVVLHVRCPGPLGSSSPVRSPGVLCGVLGHLAPVHRCARSVCCAVSCVCGALLRVAHSSIRTVAIRTLLPWIIPYHSELSAANGEIIFLFLNGMDTFFISI